VFFACLEVFHDMQVTQAATVIDPDSRSCVSVKWLWLQLYTALRLSAHWRALNHAHATGRPQFQAVPGVGHLFVFGLWRTQRTYSMLHVVGAGYFFFVSSANPQLLSLYQWLAPSLAHENSSGQKYEWQWSSDLCQDYKNYR
jgi:hypothetical protein